MSQPSDTWRRYTPIFLVMLTTGGYMVKLIVDLFLCISFHTSCAFLLAAMLLDKSWTARQVVKTKLWGNLSAETKDTTKYGSVLFFFYVSAFPSFFFFFGALFKHAQALSSSVPEPKGQPSQQMLLIACPCSTHFLRLRAVIPLCYIVNMYIYFFHLFHWHYLTKSVQCIWSLRACSSSRDLNQKSHVGAA